MLVVSVLLGLGILGLGVVVAPGGELDAVGVVVRALLVIGAAVHLRKD